MTERIVIAGGSGFVGRYLERHYRASGAEVVLVGRAGPDVRWDDAAGLRTAVTGADAVINLAGKSVNCRYGDANRAEIFRSRLATTKAVREAIAASDAPPPVWFNASTATIYRHAEDRPMTESTGELGTGFSVNVAKAWERELFEGDLPATRRVALRMAIVLGDGSALTPLVNLVRFGLGGPQVDGPWFATAARRNAGTFHEYRARGGRQKFSWVHIADVLGAIEFLRAHPELDGPVNVAAPHPTDNRSLMALLRRLLGVRVGLPAYRWMLEVGSAAIRTETELVLKSRWVEPERLLDAGYHFAFPDLEPALRDILGERGLLHAPNAR
ncbi:NAD-dependent epimerase [Leifsonia xyli]|uniref:epimerase n=1 Tax=Leifsonia xyli TaxID=1575 RepID=UPI0007CDD3CF|nr:NAD-dependent epimerase [Leifsonia xyli]